MDRCVGPLKNSRLKITEKSMRKFLRTKRDYDRVNTPRPLGRGVFTMTRWYGQWKKPSPTERPALLSVLKTPAPGRKSLPSFGKRQGLQPPLQMRQPSQTLFAAATTMMQCCGLLRRESLPAPVSTLFGKGSRSFRAGMNCRYRMLDNLFLYSHFPDIF